MQPFRYPDIRRTDLPATPESPAHEKESHFGSEGVVRRVMEHSQSVVREYEANRDGLVPV